MVFPQPWDTLHLSVFEKKNHSKTLADCSIHAAIDHACLSLLESITCNACFASGHPWEYGEVQACLQ